VGHILTEEEVEQAAQTYQPAWDILSELCQGTHRWTMCVPVQEATDSDRVLGRALSAIPNLVETIRELKAALRRYGRHDDECARLIMKLDFPCKCGFKQVLLQPTTTVAQPNEAQGEQKGE